MVRWLVLSILAGALTIAQAQSLSDYRPRKPLPIPSWEAGASYDGRYYSNALEHWIDLDWTLRTGRHIAVSSQIGAQIGDPGYLATLGLRWYPDGRIGRIGYENWVEINAGGISRRTPNPDDPGCSDCETWLASPILFFSYGRDFLPWDQASWGMRVGLFAGVAFGNALFRQETGIFGMDQTTLGWLMVGIRIGIFHLSMKQHDL